MIVAGATTVLGVLIASSAGYAISRMKFPGHKPLMWTFLLTQMFPVAVLIVPLYNLLGRLGLIDSYAGLILVYCTIAVPFCAWMLKGYFDTIPHEIDEAGRVDGLTPFGTFWRLIVPLARPGLAVTAFYSFLTAWGEVAYSSQFMSERHYTLAAGIRTFAGDERANWGAMTAASVLDRDPRRLRLPARPAPPGHRPDGRRHQGLIAARPQRRCPAPQFRMPVVVRPRTKGNP